MGKREDELNRKALEQMHKDIYNAAHPRAQEPVVEEEVIEEDVPVDKLPEVQPVPEPEPDGEEEANYSLDVQEHRDKPPSDIPTTDQKIKTDLAEMIANPPKERLIEMSEVPDGMVIPLLRLILKKAAADLTRTRSLDDVLIDAYAIIMRARGRKLIIDLQKLFQTQVDREGDKILPGMDIMGRT